MQVLRRATEKLTNWWNGRRTEDVYHPDGNFDKIALIEAVQDVERRNSRPARIIMTHFQYYDYVVKETSLAWCCGVIGYGERNVKSFMDCKIEVDDVPRWCVGIETEED